MCRERWTPPAHGLPKKKLHSPRRTISRPVQAEVTPVPDAGGQLVAERPGSREFRSYGLPFALGPRWESVDDGRAATAVEAEEV